MQPGTSQSALPPTIVATDCGPIVGSAKANVRAFLGIPYAAPPVGSLRWKPPAPAERWSARRDATRRGHACPQPNIGGVVRDSAEDCLTLNIWLPEKALAPLPVLVWIHGGAFFQGSGGDDFHDGARLARRAHAIIVTLNYRLGPLGFMAHRQLAKEAGRRASPSFGILDQRAALQWVQHNIGAFGGDPARVTLFGESAGAWSVCSHLASPGSRGLFARAIIQSGACSDALYFGPEEAEAQGAALADAVGCRGNAVLDCLRAKSAEEIVVGLPMKRALLLPPGVWWGSVVDGVELPRQPLDSMRVGDFARVPLIIGWNRDEGTLSIAGLDRVDSAEVEEFVRYVFGDRAAAVVPARYARATLRDSLADIVTDGVYACEARRVARAVSMHGVPVYLYQWTRALDHPEAHALGATHSVELFFLWGNPGNGIALSNAELPLSHLLMEAWGRFALTGNPSGGAIQWPRYSADRDELLVLDMVPRTATRVKMDACDSWDKVRD